MKHCLFLILALVLAGCNAPAVQQQSTVVSNPEATNREILVEGFNPNLSGEEIADLCTDVLAVADARFEALEKQQDPVTMQNVFGRYDSIIDELNKVRHLWHLSAVHPEESIRDAATDCNQRVSAFYDGVELSREFYEIVAAIDKTELPVLERYIVDKTLEEYRRSGVDKDAETREKIRQLKEGITETGIAFLKNIRTDVRYVMAQPEQLRGLPKDYLEKHPVNEDGLIKISTDYPDYFPVMNYSESDELRRSLYIAFSSRGYPENKEILKALIQKRHALANLIGFRTYAELSMNDKMIGSPAKVKDFLGKVATALEGPVKRESEILLAELKKIDPAATEVQVWQKRYLQNRIRQAEYAFDSQEVRQYFQYEKVRDGIFKLTEDLFGVKIRPWVTATWHEEVETYEILEDGKLLGRFYMDNHPRENKYKHAAHWTIRTGIKDKQIPISALAQNFPKGLMSHGDVETFLHEFGHLLHNIFSGEQQWYAVAGMRMERDFVEAPSQMLEEWIWDYQTLKTFAVNAESETIPVSLVDKMNRTRYFGRATGTAGQIYFAQISLNYYNRDPDSFEPEQLIRQLSTRYSPFPYVEGSHFYSNFGHLYGYSSNYYTYQWSLAIATDLFSRFKEEGLRNRQVSQEYRDKILAVGGSKPAAEFVADFLGRPFSPEAYLQELEAL